MTNTIETDEVETVECDNCGTLVERDNLITWRVARQTHWEPAEWADGCIKCIPTKFRNAPNPNDNY